VDLTKVSRKDWIIGGTALLLVIDLWFLPWFTVSIGIYSGSSSGTGTPDGWLGWLAVLSALALIADLAVERFSPATTLPAIGGSRATTRLALAAAAAVFVLLKFVFHTSILGASLGFGFFAALVLAAALLFLNFQARSSTP
jgi:hypothetical protein